MKPRVLVVSSANMDFVQRMQKIPLSGQTLIEKEGSYAWNPGGKGANSAITFARLGTDCVFCCRLGNDSNGNRLVRLYQKEGVDTRFVFLDNETPSGLASIIVEENGNNRIIVYPGANEKLSEADIEEAMTCLPDAVFMHFEISEEAALATARFASKSNIPLIIDAGPAKPDFPLDQLGPVEIFSPNETETFAYTGIHPISPEMCLKACIRLSTKVHAKYIVLKLGKQGSFLYDGKFYHVIPPFEVPVVDTTAAGDVFTAALTARYVAGFGILDSVRYATYAAAVCVSKAGAYPSIPTIDEIEALRNSDDI